MNVILVNVQLDNDNWVYTFKFVNKEADASVKHIAVTICSATEQPYKLGSTYTLHLHGEGE